MQDEPNITVSGSGSADAPADAVRLAVEAVASAPSVPEAVQHMARAVGELGAAAREHGLSDAQVSTRGVRVQPEHSRDGWQVTGFRAAHSVELHCTDLVSAGELLTALAARLGDTLRVDRLEPVVTDPSGLAERARERAFAQARAKAEQLAALSGQPLGQVVAVVESEEGGFAPVALMSGGAERAGMPIEPGSSSVEVSLRVTWRLGSR